MFIPVRRDQLLPGLAAGKGDIAAANLTITPERRKLVDFSAAGMTNVSEVVVSGPASPQVASVDDLSGKEVFVRKSSSYYESLVALNKKFAAEKKPPVILKEAPENAGGRGPARDAQCRPRPDRRSSTSTSRTSGSRSSRSSPCTTTSRFAPAARSPGRSARTARSSRQRWTTSSARNKVGTATGNQILTRYLKSVKYVKNATSEEERKKFLALIQYFQKYGDQYDVDWVLMGAQGYQESQLNQKAKSAVGAIGVMQVMPATGKDMKVGDITEIEPNIHAGIKYMRWMIDHYYDKEPMTQAGQGACSRSRRTTPARAACHSCARKPPSAGSIPTSGSRTSSTWRPRRSARKR